MAAVSGSTGPSRRRRETSGSLSEAAYRLLKWQILSLEIAPGSFLNEQDLAASTGFGRTPIHQALHRLQYDGLVEIRPRKGVIVRSWSPADVRCLIEVRRPLEEAMVRLAAERAALGEIVAARQLLATGRPMIAAGDREGLLRLDHAFHGAIAAMARNPVLAEVVESLHQRSTLLWFLPVSDQPEYEAVQKQHEAILAGISARDGVAAARAMRVHLESFLPS